MMPKSPLHVTSPTPRAPRILIRTRQNAAKGNATARANAAAKGSDDPSTRNGDHGSLLGGTTRGSGPAVLPSTAAAWAAWEEGVHCVRVSDRRGVAHKQWTYTLDRSANTLVGRSPQTASATAFVHQTTTSAYTRPSVGAHCLMVSMLCQLLSAYKICCGLQIQMQCCLI
jgi:hypothetical protein